MGNHRVIIFVTIVLSILLTTLVLIQFAKGYRPDINSGTLKPTGLLVAGSIPQGAQVLIDGQLSTATDDTINLDPGEYTVEIKKEGLVPWTKNLKIFQGLVTQTNAILFPIVPDLKALTFTGAVNPSLSPSGTKIIYSVPNEINNTATNSSTSARNLTNNSNSTAQANTKTGLWVLELADLPLGFSRDPRQIIIDNPDKESWADAEFIWSPDSREILAMFYAEEATSSSTTRVNTNNKNTSSNLQKLPEKVYRISLSQTIPSRNLSNIITNYQLVIDEWNEEISINKQEQLKTLPEELAGILATTSAELKFSPDESKLLYTATASATLLDNYIPAVPAASTQPQNRTLSKGSIYIYDIKEDRNFLIETGIQPSPTSVKSVKSESIEQLTTTLIQPTYQWFPSSNHLIHVKDNQITIMEYDNTNKATVYSGNIPALQVFAHPSTSKLIILTSLNPAQSPTPNLYTLILR